MIDKLRELRDRWEAAIAEYDQSCSLSDPEDWMAGHRACLEELDAMLATHDRGGWLPIESAPRDGTRILTCTPSGYIAVLAWSAEMECLVNNNWREFSHATHWQPLPPPPRTSEGE